MTMRLIACIAASTAAVLANQLPARIDFQRDVQPIFREHCVSCHGPDQQMSGLRLDRRADALRGGSQSDIGPGTAQGSRLYHRLIGTTFGMQMPPAGPLGAEQIETIKQWIDEGADWPDAVSGEVPAPPADPGAARLMALIREDDRRAIDALLREKPRAATARGPRGSTPLMTAALYGDTALVKRLLAAGADPNATNSAGATALMWAVPDSDKMELLLDAGADANARSGDRRSALVVASGIVGAAPALRLLLDYGADPWVWQATDPSPLREAARVDDAEMFRVLMEYGANPKGASGVPATFLRTNCFRCAELAGAGGPLSRRPAETGTASIGPRYDPGRSARPTPVGATPATPATIRAAIERSLPLLQDAGVSFVKQSGCVSCHHNSVVSMAVAAARANGYTVNEATAKQQSSLIGAYLDTWSDRTIQNMFIAGQADSISYVLFGLAADNYPPDVSTDAQAMWLKRRQAPDGRWVVTAARPPIESNDIEVTAVSMRALQVFAPPSRRVEYTKAVDRARAWLTMAPASSTEERAFRLLGLSWAGASTEIVKRAARDLLVTQRDDGGWAQLETMGSDAYATGEALVALRESRTATPTDLAYRKGVEFLLRTQIEDGSWFVETRAVPIQAYFESGFPYGVNQWISAAATGWATTALALAGHR
jgi:ankyrin repeat protein/mono/diheme cytochrome c family protein